MSEVTFDLSEFDTAARSFAAAHTTGTGYEQRLAGMRVPDSMFGRVPWLSDALSSPYTEHFDACTEALMSTVASLQTLSDAMIAVRDAYAATEEANREAAQASSGMEMC